MIDDGEAASGHGGDDGQTDIERDDRGEQTWLQCQGYTNVRDKIHGIMNMEMEYNQDN